MPAARTYNGAKEAPPGAVEAHPGAVDVHHLAVEADKGAQEVHPGAVEGIVCTPALQIRIIFVRIRIRIKKANPDPYHVKSRILIGIKVKSRIRIGINVMWICNIAKRLCQRITIRLNLDSEPVPAVMQHTMSNLLLMTYCSLIGSVVDP
jgi:hypothetical protein